MLKKIICCVIGFSMIASVLAGCSGDNATTTQKAVTESETITTTESSEPVTLNILKADAQQQQQWEELGEEYNKQFPNVTLNFQSIDNDIWSILKTKLNAGEPPDLFVVTGYNYMNVYKDYLLDLTNETFVENFDEQMLAPSKVDGKILGVPMELTIGGLIYNKKMFADAGIAELPKTLSELEEACKKLEAKGYTPFSNGYKEFWVFKHIMVHYMGQEIGDPATIADELNAGTNVFAEPTCRSVAELERL
jgi:raffinose/stachyose/melibiose transport system substrate-binding protein